MLPEVPRTDAQHALRESLELRGADDCSFVVVDATYYQLAREIGLDTDSGDTYDKIRRSIERLWKVSIIAEMDGVRQGYRLLSSYRSSNEKTIQVALNPRITAAVLGKSEGTGSHTRLLLSEIRTIRHDATRIIHQYLCALIPQGQSSEIKDETLCRRVWPNAYGPKQSFRLKSATAELEALGWQFSLRSDSRKNAGQRSYKVWRITRPTAKDAPTIDVSGDTDNPEHTETPENSGDSGEETRAVEAADIAAMVKRKPGQALRDHADKLSPDEFARCIARQPTSALRYCLDRLTDEQFSAVVTKSPAGALIHARDRLTDEQLARAVAAKPGTALKHALTRLTPEQFVSASVASQFPIGNPGVTDGQLDAWFDDEAHSAVLHLQALHPGEYTSPESLVRLLSPSRLAICVRRWPADFATVAPMLPPDLFEELVQNHQDLIVQYAPYPAAHEVVAACILAEPSAAIRYRLDELDEDQRKYVLKKSPWTAMGIQRAAITDAESKACNKILHKVAPSNPDPMIRECPEYAQRFTHYLKHDQLAECARRIEAMRRPRITPFKT
jgi:hypothetical protein